ncbi:uncharacterized protein LOC113497529 [Trichoplusia ni]|uniref:Uncharacterized protein LOC113497529 n=1 Tax=Trichoplusia ni TaxID=7111 RepID=A0A7E5VX44_TRINI|nr:uncharacterized protein LOC113497529 [Trichoplusia ni]
MTKECDSLPKDPVSCDHEMCVAKKTGFITADGDIDKDKAIETLEKSHAGEPAMINAIKTKCFDGDISTYGPPDFCDLIKFKMCYKTQVFSNCREWNNSGDCKGVKELSEECNKIFS